MPACYDLLEASECEAAPVFPVCQRSNPQPRSIPPKGDEDACNPLGGVLPLVEAPLPRCLDGL